MQKLGQHFLKNKAVLEEIVSALELKRGDRVIEIGPGHGELTIPLLAVAEKTGASVISIEKDRTLIPALAELQKKNSEVFEVTEGDALKTLSEIVPAASYKIVGNIPYYITGKLLRVISELEHKPEVVVLLIQKEVAERICAEPPEMNRLAASVQFWSEPEIIARVSKKDFSPPPEVDSAVIVLKTKSSVAKNFADGPHDIEAEHYYRAVRGIFAQPRKNLLNNIAAAQPAEAKKGIGKTEIAEYLKTIGVKPESRPQDLSIADIIAIAQKFF